MAEKAGVDIRQFYFHLWKILFEKIIFLITVSGEVSAFKGS
jgi:hypothetical protein